MNLKRPSSIGVQYEGEVSLHCVMQTFCQIADLAQNATRDDNNL